MAENNKFYKEKFFYIIIILCVGSWGWATYLDAKQKDKVDNVEKTMITRDDTILKTLMTELKENNKNIVDKLERLGDTVAELKVDIKWLKNKNQWTKENSSR